MKVISHRAYLNGPDKFRENNPEAIDEAIRLGFTVEIDLRIIAGELCLGHSISRYIISEDYLKKRKNNLIIHAKDIDTAAKLSSTNYNWFFHENDAVSVTSWKWLWLYPGQYHENGIVLNFKDPYMFGFESRKCFGVCVDYPLKYKSFLSAREL